MMWGHRTCLLHGSPIFYGLPKNKKNKNFFIWVRLIQDKASFSIFLDCFCSGNDSQKRSANTARDEIHGNPPADTPGPDTILLFCSFLFLVLAMAISWIVGTRGKR